MDLLERHKIPCLDKRFKPGVSGIQVDRSPVGWLDSLLNINYQCFILYHLMMAMLMG
jgi:hypothetical protein